MIVICGATGKIGGTAARALRSRGLPVTAVVRDAAKASPLDALGCTLAIADLGDERAVTAAFRGADAVLVICPLRAAGADVEGEAVHIIDVLGAALASTRPQSVVAISDYGAHVPTGTGITLIFRRLEERLRAVSTNMTFLRSAEHMQNWFRQLRAARSRGVLPSLHHPVSRPFPTVSAFDVGKLAAELLERPGDSRRAPRVIHMEGPRRYAAADVAAAFARSLGCPVTALELPRDQWAAGLAAGGLSDSYARLVMELQDAHNARLIDAEPGGDVRRGTTELEQALGDLPSA